MPYFGLKNVKKKLSANSLALRKTQSTGDIEDSRPVLNTSNSNNGHSNSSRNSTNQNRKASSFNSGKRPLSPRQSIYYNVSNQPNDSTISSILITSASYVGDQATPRSQQPQQQQQQQTDQNITCRSPGSLLSQNKTLLPPVLESESSNESNINHTNEIKTGQKTSDLFSPLSSTSDDYYNEETNSNGRERLAARLRDLTAVDMDLLLSLETQARMDHQEEKEQLERERRESEQSFNSSNSMCTSNSGRPSRLRFDIPDMPAIRSPDQESPSSQQEDDNTSVTDQQGHGRRRWSLPDIPLIHQQQRQNRITRWGRSILFRKHSEQEVVMEAANEEDDGGGGGVGGKSLTTGTLGSPSTLLSKTKSNTSNASNSSGSSNQSNTKKKKSKKQQQQNKNVTEITVGCRVQLYKRPLPIIGTVKYIGTVHFDKTGEEWLGIELDGRVGNMDGKVDDIQYFQCNPNCGIFAKKEDARRVS